MFSNSTYSSEFFGSLAGNVVECQVQFDQSLVLVSRCAQSMTNEPGTNVTNPVIAQTQVPHSETNALNTSWL